MSIAIHFQRALTIAGLALFACGDSGATTTQSSNASETGDAPASALPKASAAPAIPQSVADLAQLVPRDATLVVGLPSLEALKTGVDPAMFGLARDAVSEQIAAKLGLPALVVNQMIDSYEGGIVFIAGDLKAPKGAAALRVKDGAPVTTALTAAKFEDKGGGRWLLPESEPVHAMWLEKTRIIVLANDEQPLLAAIDALSRKQPSFTESPSFRPRRPGGLWVAADLAALASAGLPDAMDAGFELLAGIEMADPATYGRLDLEYTQVGGKVPRLGLVLAPSSQTAMASLPAGALMAIGASIKRAPGKTLKDVLSELGRADAPRLAADADAALQSEARISLDQLDGALGDEIALGVYHTGGKLDMTKGAAFATSGAVLIDIATRDDVIAAQLVDAVAKLIPKKGLTPGAGRFGLDTGDGYALDVAASAGHVRIAFGGSTAMARARDAAPKTSDRLGADPLFLDATKGMPATSQLAFYGDFAALAKILPDEMNAAQMKQLGSMATLLAVSFKPFDKGVDLVGGSGGGLGAVAAIGSLSAVAIYGVRRYLSNAKTSEAKSSLGAIARGAVSAYEREQTSGPAHALCGSAAPVPAAVPGGRKYQPDASDGKDYETGTASAGWRCLKFTITSPQYYQYEYRVGGNYKGPKRGGPDPGPDGFEASAEGDLDGDGITSLFTLTGKVDPQTRSVKMSTQIFIADEHE